MKLFFGVLVYGFGMCGAGYYFGHRIGVVQGKTYAYNDVAEDVHDIIDRVRNSGMDIDGELQIRVIYKLYYERKKTKLTSQLFYGGLIMYNNNYGDMTNEVKYVIVDGVRMTYAEWIEMKKSERD